eukprot:208681_1
MSTGNVPTVESQRRPSVSEQVADKLLTPKFRLMWGIACSVLLIFEGFLCFYICILNVRSYILSFYYLVFGTLSICAELKFKFIYRNMKIIHSNIGRGLWYAFLGTLALGREWWGWFCAIILILLGILNIVAGCYGHKEVKQSLSSQDQNDQKQSLSALQTIQLAQKAKSISENMQPLNKAYDDPSENQNLAG